MRTRWISKNTPVGYHLRERWSLERRGETREIHRRPGRRCVLDFKCQAGNRRGRTSISETFPASSRSATAQTNSASRLEKRAPAVKSPKNKEKKRLEEEKSKKRGSSEASDPLTILVGVASPPSSPLDRSLALPLSRISKDAAVRDEEDAQNTEYPRATQRHTRSINPLPPPRPPPPAAAGEGGRALARLPTKVNKTRAFNSDPTRSAAAIKRRHGSRSFTKAIQDTGAIRV